VIALQLALQLVLPTSALPTSAVLAAAGGPAWPTLAIEILGSGGVRTCRSAGHTADSGRCVRLPRASADAGRFSLMIILALFVGLGPLARYARARMPTAASQLVLCFKRQDPPPSIVSLDITLSPQHCFWKTVAPDGQEQNILRRRYFFKNDERLFRS
jgi:hypothetical protein